MRWAVIRQHLFQVDYRANVSNERPRTNTRNANRSNCESSQQQPARRKRKYTFLFQLVISNEQQKKDTKILNQKERQKKEENCFWEIESDEHARTPPTHIKLRFSLKGVFSPIFTLHHIIVSNLWQNQYDTTAINNWQQFMKHSCMIFGGQFEPLANEFISIFVEFFVSAVERKTSVRIIKFE